MSQAPRPSDAAALAEYGALRAELLHRTGAQDQLLTFTLLTAGALLALVIEFEVAPLLLWLYPVWIALLAAAWAHHDGRRTQICAYIREHIEPQVPGLGWQSFRYAQRAAGLRGRLRALADFAAGGIFLTTEVMAVALAVVEERHPDPSGPKPLGSFTALPTSQALGVLLLSLGAVAVTALLVARRPPD